MDDVFLKQRFSELSEEELLLIFNENSKDYTKEALEIVKAELEKRAINVNTKEKDDQQEDKEVYISVNIISAIIKIIGGLSIAFGVIAGVALISDQYTGISIIAAVIPSGFLFLGLGEVISLLHQINERQRLK